MTAIPKEIIEGIKTIRGKVGSIQHDSENKHGGYNYVSIDTYYEKVARLANEAGLVWRTKEKSFDLIPNQGKDKNRTYAKATFNYSLYAGAMAAEDWMEITIIIPIDGPQTTGSLYSYADKVFMRVAFCVVTGEKDADAMPQEDMLTPPAIVQASQTGSILDQVTAPAQVPHDDDGVVIDLPPGQAAIAPTFKDSLPIVDTKKIEPTEAGRKAVETVTHIFKVFLPKVTSVAKLDDWYAENLAAVEKADKAVPGSKAIIVGLFRDRRGAISGKPKAPEKLPEKDEFEL